MQHACPQVTRQNLVIKYLLTQGVFAFNLVFLLSFCLSIGMCVSLGLHTLFGYMTQVLSCPFAYETSLMFHIMVRVRVYCLCACVWYTSVTPKHPSWWLVSQFSARPRRFQTQSSKTGGYLLEMDLFRILASFLFVLYRWLCWPDIWPKVKPHDGWQGTKKIKPDRPFKSSNNAEARTNNLPWKQWNDRAPHDVDWNYCALYRMIIMRWKMFFALRRKIEF